jgi:uncharacterized protein (TIGR00661 family)
MRILYGVVGEGMGHATRSRVILEHLTQAGHEVHVVASGRAHDYLKARFSGVHKIWGFTIAYENGGVGKFDTFMQNLKGAFHGWPENVKQYFELVKEFKPEAVISDFESFSYMFAKNYLLPVISIDNMQIINRCKHEPEVLKGYENDFELTKAIVKSKLPGAYHYLITTFFYPEVRKKRTSLLPSILRPEILASKSEEGEHLLVYQTSDSVKDLGGLLKATGRVCKVYGYKRNLKEPEVDGNVHFMPFSEEGFINDLRTCKGVVANGGFTLMSESVYLHKPFMSMPIGGQFEQILNARYLEKMNFGVHAPELDAKSLGAFLEKVPDCARSLAAYQQDGNQAMFAAIDGLLKRIAAGERPLAEEMSIQ